MLRSAIHLMAHTKKYLSLTPNTPCQKPTQPYKQQRFTCLTHHGCHETKRQPKSQAYSASWMTQHLLQCVHSIPSFSYEHTTTVTYTTYTNDQLLEDMPIYHSTWHVYPSPKVTRKSGACPENNLLRSVVIKD
jgi:hypothetical protein